MRGVNGIIQFQKLYSADAMEQIVCSSTGYKSVYVDTNCSLGTQAGDVGERNSGVEPVWNKMCDKCCMFYGELYNYKELKEMLESNGNFFVTYLDAEVVLCGYEKFGSDFFIKMDGKFICVIYDLKRMTWTLARDRVGANPLYYYCTKDYFLFATEVKSLLDTELVPKIIDKEALSRYLQLTYIPAPKSIIKNVLKLMPASTITVSKNGEMYPETYWNLEVGSDDSIYENYDECKKMLKNYMFSSVEKRMHSNESLGAFLSGGFDSTIVVGIMSQISDKPVNTFTVGFEEKQYDESELARIVANRNNTNHRVLPLDWNQTVENIEYILNFMDEPYADSSLIASYAISKMAQDYVDVVLTGDAGDELFAGYNKYLVSYYSQLYNRIPAFLQKSIIEPAAQLLPARSTIARKVNKMIRVGHMDIYQQRKSLMSLGFKEDELKMLMKDNFVDSMDFILEQYNTFNNAEEQVRTQYVDFKTVLEGDMMTKAYRASTMTALKTRAPLLDNMIVELAFKMPSKFKINKKERKIILKDTFKELIPSELFKASKRGFSVPIGEWLENNLKTQLYEYANEEFLREQGLFEPDYIHKIIDAHMKHKENRYSELWAFYVFQHWYKRVFQ